MGFLRGARGDVRGDRGSARRVRVQRGWFGRGSFTDHSNLDVVPALLAGVALMTLYLFRKARLVVFRPGVSARHRPAGAGDLRVPNPGALWDGNGRAGRRRRTPARSGRLAGSVRCHQPGDPLRRLRRVSLWFGRSDSLARRDDAARHSTHPSDRDASPCASCAISARRVRRALLQQNSPVLCRIGERAPPVAAG